MRAKWREREGVGRWKRERVVTDRQPEETDRQADRERA